MTNTRFRAALAGAAMTVFACVAAPQASAEDLLDIYQRALQSDPQIREAEANLLANSELRPQARGLLFPQINASGSETRSENGGVQVFPAFDEDSGQIIQATNTFESENIEQTFWQLQLRQTVFRWDQFIGLQQADKRVAEAEANYEGAQQGLMLRVAERYFDVLAAEDSLEASEANKTAIAKQLDQAQKRFEVGLIAITDVQESQAAFDQAVADEIAAKRTLANAKNLLAEITGDSSGDLAKPGAAVPLIAPSPADEDQWVARALEQNLDLIASRISADIASKEVSSRRSGYMPTLDLVVSRSSNENDQEQSNNGLPFQDVFSSSDQDSISLQFNVPIFAGGTNTSRVREAVYLHRAARERAQRIARETERLARDSYLGVLAEISRTKALEQALKSSEVALEATQAGFEVGTRTTVDVLDAQRQLFNARTQYLRARYDYLLNVLRLKQASGALQVQDLERINSLLEG
ncbi:MAG: TolC family outer membrane protein [Pseudomonadota bacterium]